MKKILLCIVLSSFFLYVNAQKVSIDITGSAPDFNYTSISDYENSKIFNNAIRLDIDSKKKKYSVYFRTDGLIRSGNGQFIPENKFGIRIHNTIPIIPLSATNDHLLFTSDKNFLNDKDIETVFLDFIIAPLYFEYDPGSYVVNILFTLTSD